MNIHSDPVVQSHEPVVVCKLCGDQGHSKISCTKAKNLANMSHEDSVFWNYVHPSDRPESLGVGASEDEDDHEGVDEDSSEEEEEKSDESFESDDSNSSD